MQLYVHRGLLIVELFLDLAIHAFPFLFWISKKCSIFAMYLWIYSTTMHAKKEGKECL